MKSMYFSSRKYDLLVVMVLMSAFISSSHTVFANQRPKPDLKAGRVAYQQHCARCHGKTGDGNGVDAKRFYPRPRDLEFGVYKFRTTESGTPPTDEDIFKTLTEGLPESNMPDWQHLDEETRWQLVYYLKSLSSYFDEVDPVPVEVTKDPGKKKISLKTGREVYKKLGCAACHGDLGRGDGSSAAGLVDDWDKPIRPANLTQGWNYRGGSEPADIMMRMLTGIDGSGMPSYIGAVTPEETWQLSYYVASLQESANWYRVTYAKRFSGKLPIRFDDQAWNKVESAMMRLRNVVNSNGEWEQPPTVNAVGVQVAYNDEAIAFRLEWDDPIQDKESPADAIAVILKPDSIRGDSVTLQAWPYKGSPMLDICYWPASTGEASEFIASSYDKIFTGKAPHTALISNAQYKDGRWSLVLERAFKPAGLRNAAHLDPNKFTSIGLAVWDGSNQNARMVSSWIDIIMNAPGEHSSASH